MGLYRLTLREVLAATFRLEHPGNVLQRLRASGLVVQHDGLPGKVSYYQLTAQGACDRVSVERARPLGATALRQHLAVLWFCLLGDRPRLRLEDRDVSRLFGDESPNARQVAYCVEDDAESRRLLRLHVPGEAVPASRVTKTLRGIVSELERRGPDVRSWLAARSLGVAVLADTSERAALLRVALAASGAFSRVHVAVHVAATPRTLTRFLAALRRQRKDVA